LAGKISIVTEGESGMGRGTIGRYSCAITLLLIYSVFLDHSSFSVLKEIPTTFTHYHCKKLIRTY